MTTHIRQQNSTVRNLVILLFILALAAFLRFYLLDGQSFWNDEGNSARIAERSLQQITEGSGGRYSSAVVLLPAALLARPLRGERVRAAFALGDAGRAARRADVPHRAQGIQHRRRFAGGLRRGDQSIPDLLLARSADVYVAGGHRRGGNLFLLRLLEDWSVRDRRSGIGIGIGPRRWSFVIMSSCHWSSCYALGLYTHYAFPFVLVTHFLIVLAWTLVTRARWRYFIFWIGLVAAAGVLFLPWLPTAIRQITTWPSARVTVDGGQMLLDTLRLYVAGPTLPTAEATVAIFVCGFFILIGLWNPIGFDERRAEARDVLPYSIRLGSIVLWWLVPIALIFAFGLFKESYLKFFIVGSAAFCILLARGISNAWGIGRGALTMPRELAGRPLAGWAWMIVVLVLCAVIAVPTFNALRNYYFDPAYARDDYRSIAQRILKTQRADDAVMLDSANQWEVFTYYYPDGPNVYPLPQTATTRSSRC